MSALRCGPVGWCVRCTCGAVLLFVVVVALADVPVHTRQLHDDVSELKEATVAAEGLIAKLDQDHTAAGDLWAIERSLAEASDILDRLARDRKSLCRTAWMEYHAATEHRALVASELASQKVSKAKVQHETTAAKRAEAHAKSTHVLCLRLQDDLSRLQSRHQSLADQVSKRRGQRDEL